MHFEIVMGGAPFGGLVEWIAAVSAGVAAYFTYRLWRTANQEIKAIGDEFQRSNEHRNRELDALQKQIDAANVGLRQQFLPVIKVELEEQKHHVDNGLDLGFGARTYPLVVNVGPGPAIHTTIYLWFYAVDDEEIPSLLKSVRTATPPGQTRKAVLEAFHEAAHLATAHWRGVAGSVGSSSRYRPVMVSQHNPRPPRRVRYDFWWAATYEDVFEQKTLQWGHYDWDYPDHSPPSLVGSVLDRLCAAIGR